MSVHKLSLEKLCYTRLYDRQRPHSEDKRAQHTAHCPAAACRDLHDRLVLYINNMQHINKTS